MRSLWLRLAAVGVGLLLAVLLGELFFIGFYFVKDGAYLSVREKLAGEGNFKLFELVDGTECTYPATLAPHPYLAFVHHSNPPCNLKEVNNVGLYGPDFPFERDPEHFVIMLTGGSVAAQVGRMTRGSLEEVLNRRYRMGNKRFRVLNGALEAWKQPQQLIMLLLYGSALDGIVTLDGYNEVVFPFLRKHTERMDKPWKESYIAANPHLAPRHLLLAAGVNNQIARLTRDHWALSRSKLFYFMSEATRGRIRAAVREDEERERGQDLDDLFALPAEWSLAERQRWNREQYRRYLLMMQAIAEQLDIRAAYFIQPIAAIGKALTEEERRVVGDASYRSQYLAMEERLLALRDAGILVTSLTGIYAGVDETLYYDPVHQGSDSAGYRLLVEKIADALEVEWGLERRD